MVAVVLLLASGCGRHASSNDKTLPSSVQPSNPCELLSRSEIEDALGNAVQDGRGGELATDTDGQRDCFWFPAGDSRLGLSLRIQTDAALAKSHIGLTAAQLVDEGANFQSVPDLGDAAKYYPDTQQLIVLKDHTVVFLQGLGPDHSSSLQTQEVGLATRILSHLPAAPRASSG
jgi:hypothetical protein